ncbi:MAG: phosphomannomutase/phosphoglucomutase, partial [Gemmatimonadetes bacterium]|nr:phosphomannomutase/phosphoglucomutase [Gemmatimonadota bacterium]
MELRSHIFRQYDIRGIVGDDLDDSVAEQVGKAYGSVLVERKGPAPHVSVGQDNRPSSPGLASGLIRGLRSTGCRVSHIGTVPTPVTYWSEFELETDGCIMITGSHNPAEYNGIKMTMGQAAIYGDAILALRDRIQAGDFVEGAEGELETLSLLPRYVDDISGRFSLPRRVKVVVDCGNGTGSVVAVELLESLGVEVVPLYCESDGTFPNHHPDPTVDEYVVDLIDTVRKTGAEVGIGFDGDADRLGAVDNEGNIIRGDVLLLLFGLDLLRRKGPGQTLVFDVKCSQVLPEEFEKAGGKAVMWKTGHSLIKEKMKETGAPLAGELSGHICFADEYLGFDDALYDACRLIDMIARSDRSLAEMAGDLPHFVSTPEIRIDVSEETKFDLVRRAQEHFRREYDVIDVDGARVLFGDGWGLLRASNTQPVIVARFEAKTEDRLSEIRDT